MIAAPERYEQLIAFLGSQLRNPVEQESDSDGSIRFTSGDPPEVIVVLTETSVIVSQFAGVWLSPYRFAARPRRVGALRWRRLPENALWTALTALIKGAREARLSQYRVCQYCERNTAPEWLEADDVCRSCAAREGGAVH